MIAHIVLFEPKPGLPIEERRAFVRLLRDTIGSIPEVKRAQVGTTRKMGQMTSKNRGQTTYSYAAILEFADTPSLERYLEHPGHELLRRQFWTCCQATLIVDAAMADVDSDDAELLV